MANVKEVNEGPGAIRNSEVGGRNEKMVIGKLRRIAT
jgi:hypothetical protein